MQPGAAHRAGDGAQHLIRGVVIPADNQQPFIGADQLDDQRRQLGAAGGRVVTPQGAEHGRRNRGPCLRLGVGLIRVQQRDQPFRRSQHVGSRLSRHLGQPARGGVEKASRVRDEGGGGDGLADFVECLDQDRLGAAADHESLGGFDVAGRDDGDRKIFRQGDFRRHLELVQMKRAGGEDQPACRHRDWGVQPTRRRALALFSQEAGKVFKQVE